MPPGKTSRFMKDFAKRAGLSEVSARRVKDAFVQALRHEAMDGKQVIIHGLGTFYKSHKRSKKVMAPYYDSDLLESRHVEMHTKPYDYLAFRAASCNRKYESDQLELDIDSEPSMLTNDEGDR